MTSPFVGGCGPIRRRHPFQNRHGVDRKNIFMNIYDDNNIEDEDVDDDDDIEETEEEEDEEDSDEDSDSEELDGNNDIEEIDLTGSTENSRVGINEPVPSTSSSVRSENNLRCTWQATR